MKKSLINYLGLLGIASFISYALAVVFSPLAYPNYNWLTQAVSDLSAANAPSKILWQQLSAFYVPCGLVCITSICIFIAEKLNKMLRVGIYLFTAMNWVSAIGYAMFPLSDISNLGGFQDIMHLIVTALVVMLSIVSLVVIMIGGFRKKAYISLAICATIALFVMFVGAIGTNIAPKEIFGVFERFSVFSATGFTAVLGVYLFLGFPKYGIAKIKENI